MICAGILNVMKAKARVGNAMGKANPVGSYQAQQQEAQGKIDPKLLLRLLEISAHHSHESYLICPLWPSQCRISIPSECSAAW